MRIRPVMLPACQFFSLTVLCITGLRSGLVRSSIHRSVWEMYDKGKKLGSGMTGDVFLVTNKVTGQAFALKSMERRKINPDLIEDLRNEIAILKMVRVAWLLATLPVFLREYCWNTRDSCFVVAWLAALWPDRSPLPR